MSYQIRDHRLVGDGVREVSCTGKESGVFTSGMPDTLVIHFTAAHSLDAAVTHLAAPDVKASAHVVIGRDGTICQLIGFDRIAWHAGPSQWEGRHGLNAFSIGIELDNAGRLTRAGNGFVAWFGRHYPADQVVEATHRNETAPTFWHIYTEEQIGACFSLCRSLMNAYPIRTIVGHEEISPGRKCDPGPAFPLDRLRDQLLVGRNESQAPVLRETKGSSRAVVDADLLNVRALPYLGAALSGAPLPRGTAVERVESSGEWCHIRVIRQGWVRSDYLREEQ